MASFDRQSLGDLKRIAKIRAKEVVEAVESERVTVIAADKSTFVTFLLLYSQVDDDFFILELDQVAGKIRTVESASDTYRGIRVSVQDRESAKKFATEALGADTA